MGDKCVNDPGKDCPNNVRLALLETRVETLEEGQDREERFRKAYYEDREARIERDTKLDAKIDSIDTKIDTVVSYQKEQQNKPNKLIDKLKDRAIEYIMLALLAFLLFKMGIPT